MIIFNHLHINSVLILMGLILIWAFLNLWSLCQASDAILRENYRSILAAENMVYAIERQDSAILLKETLDSLRECP